MSAQTLKSRAAVAFAPNEPLRLVTIDVAPPKAGEVRVRIIATGVCHTDAFTLSGGDPEGIFPTVLGHEGGGVVESIGEGVTSLQVGDHVIPLYTAECRQCKFCLSGKTNLCQAVRATQGKGLMPDGTSRFSYEGQPLFHYMGCSTFSEYTVLPEISLAKISKDAPLDQVRLLGCGVTTGIGAVLNGKVEAGASVAIFGLGGIGLAAIIGAKMANAGRILAIDINPAKRDVALSLGATDFINPKEDDRPIGRHRRTHRRWRGLLLRMRRQCTTDARGAGVLPQGLGRVDHHRCGRCRPGNQHPPVPACHRSRMARQRLRRREGPHRASQLCREGQPRGNPAGNLHHPQHAPWTRSTTPSS